MPNPNMHPLADRRANPRQAMHERARILAGDAARGCIVIDMSAGGARIGLGAEGPLPLRFDLEFLSRGRRVPVQLIWQHGLVAGVRFDLRPTLRERLDALFRFVGRRSRPGQARSSPGLVLHGKPRLPH